MEKMTMSLEEQNMISMLSQKKKFLSVLVTCSD